MIRAVSPSSYLYSHKASNIAFSKLKFELDKTTKEYLLKLSSEDELSAIDILETAESTELMMHNLTNRANSIAQDNIDKSILKGKTIDEVWPNDTVVKITVKPRRTPDEKMLLNAYFNENFYLAENYENLCNPHGPDRTKVNAIALWSFLSNVSTNFGDSLKSFVDKSMKKNSKFYELEQAKLQNCKIAVDEDEEIAKQKLKKWLNL